MDQTSIPWKGWVVVCDGAKALFFRNEGDAELLNLKLMEEMDDEAPPAHELGTDRPGRVFSSVGTARSSVENTDFHDKAEADFLSAVAEKIGNAVHEHDIASLTVVAPPRALGLLRASLPSAAQAVVKAEIAKDLVRMPTNEIEKHLAS